MTFSYDNNGNTLTKVDASGTTTYAWHYENRLTSVTLPSSAVVSFKYDPLGRRIQKATASATTIYAYDGENIVEETNSSGTAQARFVMGLNIDEPLAQLRSAATHFYNADGLGSVTSLTNGSGTVAASYTYDTFGNLAASSGSVTNPFRFTAREWDGEVGLYFYRARYLDPTNGRFVSSDPVGFNAGPNFYSYVANDPVRWDDPDGLQKRDRGTAAKPQGTPNPFKHMKPHPTKPDKVVVKDPHTGKPKEMAKPPGFDEYWEKKHPTKKPSPAECPKPEEPAKMEALEFRDMPKECWTPFGLKCYIGEDGRLHREQPMIFLPFSPLGPMWPWAVPAATRLPALALAT